MPENEREMQEMNDAVNAFKEEQAQRDLDTTTVGAFAEELTPDIKEPEQEPMTGSPDLEFLGEDYTQNATSYDPFAQSDDAYENSFWDNGDAFDNGYEYNDDFDYDFDFNPDAQTDIPQYAEDVGYPTEEESTDIPEGYDFSEFGLSGMETNTPAETADYGEDAPDDNNRPNMETNGPVILASADMNPQEFMNALNDLFTLTDLPGATIINIPTDSAFSPTVVNIDNNGESQLQDLFYMDIGGSVPGGVVVDQNGNAVDLLSQNGLPVTIEGAEQHITASNNDAIANDFGNLVYSDRDAVDAFYNTGVITDGQEPVDNPVVYGDVTRSANDMENTGYQDLEHRYDTPDTDQQSRFDIPEYTPDYGASDDTTEGNKIWMPQQEQQEEPQVDVDQLYKTPADDWANEFNQPVEDMSQPAVDDNFSMNTVNDGMSDMTQPAYDDTMAVADDSWRNMMGGDDW